MDVRAVPSVAQEVAELAKLMLAHEEGIAKRQTQLVCATVPEYASAIDRIALSQSQVRHIRDIFTPLIHNSPAGIESFAGTARDLAIGMAKRVLGGLDCLPTTDRKTILETFGVWLDNQGSADGAAKQLFVHPNTVRNRLRRLEERTGQCLSKPRSVAELSVAYEIDRRLQAAKAEGSIPWPG